MKMKTKVNSKRPKGHAAEVVVFGVVQGVGFRPFVYRLAHEFHYKGWVKNIGFGVEIHVESEEKTDFKEFLKLNLRKKQTLKNSLKPCRRKSPLFLRLKKSFLRQHLFGT
jgi:hydrogenase maturation protein HypF